MLCTLRNLCDFQNLFCLLLSLLAPWNFILTNILNKRTPEDYQSILSFSVSISVSISVSVCPHPTLCIYAWTLVFFFSLVLFCPKKSNCLTNRSLLSVSSTQFSFSGLLSMCYASKLPSSSYNPSNYRVHFTDCPSLGVTVLYCFCLIPESFRFLHFVWFSSRLGRECKS